MPCLPDTLLSTGLWTPLVAPAQCLCPVPEAAPTAPPPPAPFGWHQAKGDVGEGGWSLQYLGPTLQGAVLHDGVGWGV